MGADVSLEVDRLVVRSHRGLLEGFTERWLYTNMLAVVKGVRKEGHTWAWHVRAMSSALAPYSIARTASPIISPALGPGQKGRKVMTARSWTE